MKPGRNKSVTNNQQTTYLGHVHDGAQRANLRHHAVNDRKHCDRYVAAGMQGIRYSVALFFARLHSPLLDWLCLALVSPLPASPVLGGCRWFGVAVGHCPVELHSAGGLHSFSPRGSRHSRSSIPSSSPWVGWGLSGGYVVLQLGFVGVCFPLGTGLTPLVGLLCLFCYVAFGGRAH